MSEPFFTSPLINIYLGNSLPVMRSLNPLIQFDGVVTDPYYYKQHDYKVEGQGGLEETLELYVNGLVEIFRPIRNLLIEGGTAYIVLGDKSNNFSPIRSKEQRKGDAGNWLMRPALEKGFYEKEPLRVPNAVIEGMQKDGWRHRNTLIWNKGTNTASLKSESPTSCHAYILQMVRAHPEISPECHAELLRMMDSLTPPDPDCHAYILQMVNWGKEGRMYGNTSSLKSSVLNHRPSRHHRHGCTFPQSLAAELLATFPPGSRILEPFMGTGTTLKAGIELGYHATGIDIDPLNLEEFKDWHESQPRQHNLYEALANLPSEAIS